MLHSTVSIINNVWKECESPRNAAVSGVLHRARAEYHITARNVQKVQDDIQKGSMANAMSSNKERDFLEGNN